MLVPACLAVYLAASGGRTAALEQYGTLKGMALPLLNFPFGLLGSLAVLLMPEITQAHIEGQTARLNALLDRMLRLTGYFSALAGTLFWVWGRPLAQLLYHSPEAGFYLEILAPAMPLMYLESMVDGAMKGIGEQKAAFRYSVWDAVLRIGGVAVLLPRYGMRGFLAVILLSSFYTCTANTGRLLLSSGTGHAFRSWLGAPLLAAAAAGAAGRGVRRALAIAMAATVLVMIPVLVFSPQMTAFFNRKPEVVAYGALLLRCISPFYVLCCFNQVYAAALRGAGNSKATMIIMLCSFVLFRQVYLFIMSHYISHELIPLVMGYPAGWLVCSAATLLYYRRAALGRRRLVEDN